MDKLTVSKDMDSIMMANSKEVNIKIASNNTIAVEEKPVTEVKVDTTVAEDTVAVTEEVVGEVATDEVVVEGEAVTEEIVGDEVIGTEDIIEEPIYGDGTYTEGGMNVDPAFGTGMIEIKDPLLSSWPFVIGISAVVLFVSVALGAFLAKRKIKKGIELYED